MLPVHVKPNNIEKYYCVRCSPNQRCKFPFEFGGNLHYDCLNTDMSGTEKLEGYSKTKKKGGGSNMCHHLPLAGSANLRATPSAASARAASAPDNPNGFVANVGQLEIWRPARSSPGAVQSPST